MAILRVLLSRWLLSLVGAAILAALAWEFGPLLPALESWVPRLGIALGLLLVWAVANLLLDLRRRRRERVLEAGVTDGAAVARADDGASGRGRRWASGWRRRWPC